MIRMNAAYHADAEGMSIPEIAKAIGQSERTTKQYIKTAKEVLG